MLSFLSLLLATLPFEKIVAIIIKQLRKMALATNTDVDDDLVDILETVLYGLIGKGNEYKANKLVRKLKEQ